jgi:hypothetical protein
MTATASGTAPRLTELAGSPWDEQLLAHFHDHVESEEGLLKAYAAFKDAGPEYVRYLVDLILGDEARHHQMFQELVNRIRSDIDWVDYDPQVPYVTKAASEQNAALADAATELLAFEHEDAKSLQKLRKELRPVRDTTLFSLLVELMDLDTKKHIAILEFIRRTAQR